MTERALSASSQKPGADVCFSRSATRARFEAMSKVPPEFLHALLELSENPKFHYYRHVATSLSRIYCRAKYLSVIIANNRAALPDGPGVPSVGA
jgi:hypothetical protein